MLIALDCVSYIEYASELPDKNDKTIVDMIFKVRLNCSLIDHLKLKAGKEVNLYRPCQFYFVDTVNTFEYKETPPTL